MDADACPAARLLCLRIRVERFGPGDHHLVFAAVRAGKLLSYAMDVAANETPPYHAKPMRVSGDFRRPFEESATSADIAVTDFRSRRQREAWA